MLLSSIEWPEKAFQSGKVMLEQELKEAGGSHSSLGEEHTGQGKCTCKGPEVCVLQRASVAKEETVSLSESFRSFDSCFILFTII